MPTGVDEKQARYLADFAWSDPGLTQNGPALFAEMRRAAVKRFAELGFPSSKNEDWKFTSLTRLAAIPFERTAPEADLSFTQAIVTKLPHDANRLVFVNGYYIPGLSKVAGGIVAGNLREAGDAHPRLLEEHLGRYAAYERHPFIALNTAFLDDGALVHIPARRDIEEPVHIVHVSTGATYPQVSYPRNLVVLEESSRATLIETYYGMYSPDESPYFANAVTEIVLGAGAVLDHYKLEMESTASFHIATVQAEQGRASSLRSHCFSFGASLARTELDTRLAEGAEATLNGLYLAGDRRHVDTRTSIDHAEPHATSHELYKGILSGHSSAVFNGRIIVRKDAQKTDAKQTNKNLLLSEGSTINTKPELQIHADDVRCTHGATIGQLDKDALFYLRSRGIGQQEAREMLILAFAREIIDAVKPEPLRKYIETLLTSQLAEENR